MVSDLVTTHHTHIILFCPADSRSHERLREVKCGTWRGPRNSKMGYYVFLKSQSVLNRLNMQSVNRMVVNDLKAHYQHDVELGESLICKGKF